MGKCFALMIFLLSCLFLLLLQNLEVVNAVGCTGSFYNVNSTYVQNRDDIFSTLADRVIANGGFYNASLGSSPNRIYALVLCQRGYDQQDCFNCVLSATRGIKKDCPTRMNSYTWDKDVEDNVSCLVRSSIHSTFGNLELEPAVPYPSPDGIDPSKNMTLFEQEWDGMVNRTVRATSVAETSSVLKYHGAIEAEFTEFEHVYMLMQCTPDITSQDCYKCLRECVRLFKNQFWGRRGGEVNRPSCFFRWDFYTFHGAFGNVTRLAAPPAQEKGSFETDKKGRSTRSWVTIAIFVALTFINVFVSIGLIKFFAGRRKSNNGINVEDSEEHSESDGQHMLRLNLGMILTATNNFSSENKLGQGGFGTVHKGILPNGQEIAVKRLSKGSGQGDTEFKNEVSLLTRLQHRNLVKLLGFCSEGDEEILIYEFVHNSSLDHFIFDEVRRSLLSWELRFRIMEGIARGLLYLHEDSQLKIIHRDLKASNILLDAEMNPKVADFGTARLFEAEETRAETRRIAGTRGYMAPEYLNHGKISAKSDIYSFGVMLLEIISGERNNSFEGEGLAAYAWKRWVEGKPETIIDPLLMKDPINEIVKLIQIGLLCVQENAAKRPTMRLVIVWFSSETLIIPLPKAPAMIGSQTQSEDSTMSMSNDSTDLSCR
ncbi:Gnk2-homologous domain-containing protein [Hirschfeldia incana]|nr:Gnk2-homologous domain-containing protein [Hirschfeldia incana]